MPRAKATFQKTHKLDSSDSSAPATEANAAQSLNVSNEVAGGLSVVPRPTQAISAELIDEQHPQKQDAFKLLEQASSLVAKFTAVTSDRVELVEQEMMGLMSGDLTVDQLQAKYGALDAVEADAIKHQLSRVMNAMGVEIEKTLVERKGIQVQKEKALTALSGLKAAFELQSEAEKVADTRDEAAYQGDKRQQSNITRTQDIRYRSDWNRLDQEDKVDRINHKSQINDIESRIRAVIRKGAQSRLDVQTYKTANQLTVADRIMAKVKARGEISK
jgi:hypothetical protein